MMRAILGLCVAAAVLLGASQPASAAFSFILTPTTSPSLTPGGPGVVLTVSALDTSAGAFGSQFFMSSIANVTTGSSNITFSNLTPFIANSTVYTATNAPGGNAIGTITATATGPSGLTTLAFRGTIGVNNVAGPLLAVGTQVTSNVATLTAVPEPSSFALIGVAGLGYVIYRKRRASKA